jgi:16S rRNA (guanine527-N7)-methyltransferase
VAKDNFQNLVSNLEKLQIGITTEQMSTFSQYTSLLRIWNMRMNLTSSRALEEVNSVHFLDSATALPTLWTLGPDQPKVLDVGTGAGFPGVPLKILAPEMNLTLLEATGKKTEFLRALTNKLEIKQIEIINDRAEIAAHFLDMREKFDFVLARAIGSLSTVSELSLPFCKIGGHVIAFKKGPLTDVQSELDAASEAIGILGGELLRMEKIPPSIFNDGRLLVIVKKIAETPSNFPRRPGRPARTPIGQTGRAQP